MDAFWQWVLGGAGVVGLVAISYLNGRITRVENASHEQAKMLHERVDKEIDTGSSRRDRLWERFDQHADEDKEFQQKILENYTTKDDLKDTEKRLIAAINGRPAE